MKTVSAVPLTLGVRNAWKPFFLYLPFRKAHFDCLQATFLAGLRSSNRWRCVAENIHGPVNTTACKRPFSLGCVAHTDGAPLCLQYTCDAEFRQMYAGKGFTP